MTDSLDRPTMLPSDDPSWEHYADTILELFGDRSLELDLTQPVQADVLSRLAEEGLGPTFAVLTVCNPYGRAMEDLWNRRLTHVLRADVETGGRSWVPADGVSRDRTHREPGVAVSIPKTDARRLASKFGQSAFFWFDGASMWIVGALVEAPDQRLPVGTSGVRSVSSTTNRTDAGGRWLTAGSRNSL